MADPLAQQAALSDAMLEEVTSDENDITVVSTTGGPPQKIQRRPGARRAPPKLDAKGRPIAGGVVDDLSIAEGGESGDEFLAAFEREFEDIKKS
jgi:hypothetical protein